MFKYNLDYMADRINFDDSLDFETTFNAAPEVWQEFDKKLACDIVEEDLYSLVEQEIVNDEDEARARMLCAIREQWEMWVK